MPSSSPSPPESSPESALAPILSLDRARQARNARAAPSPEPTPAQARAQVLTQVVRSGRLPIADLFAMVRLGIVTDHPDMLPCADRHRRHNASDWEQRFVAGAKQPGALPSPSQVGCPLLAHAASADHLPACAEALRVQAQIPRFHPDQGFIRREPAPEDPVLQHQFRPCLLLGRDLLRHTLLPLLENE